MNFAIAKRLEKYSGVLINRQTHDNGNKIWKCYLIVGGFSKNDLMVLKIPFTAVTKRHRVLL